MIQGVPIGLPVFFIPLVVNIYLLVNLFETENFDKRFFYSIGLIVLIDLVLDPAAVSLGIWTYSKSLYYGVPLSNFLSWILSGSLAVLTLQYGFERSELVERLNETEYMLDDMVSFVFLWGLVNLYYGNIIPVVVASFFAALLYRTNRFDFSLSLIEKRKDKG
jgi:putative membrane protein